MTTPYRTPPRVQRWHVELDAWTSMAQRVTLATTHEAHSEEAAIDAARSEAEAAGFTVGEVRTESV